MEATPNYNKEKPIAPDHDMGNVPPHIPPASREVSSLTHMLFGFFGIAIGLAIAALGGLGLLGFRSYETWSDALFVVLAGLSFAGAGVVVMRRGLWIAIVLLGLATLFGVMSTM